jgi:hypothetical protein
MIHVGVDIYVFTSDMSNFKIYLHFVRQLWKFYT